MKDFWKNLKKPFTVLAPMEDVTDIVFRQMISNIYPPDVFFTEFVNVEGLMSEGKEAIIHRLELDPNNKVPLIAQIWGIQPENFYNVAKMINGMGFSGIDINMGCPQRNVTNSGACSALIKNPELAKEIIEATKKGAWNLPVSVKTRIGFNKIATEEWIGFLLNQNLGAITVHLRTSKEMSKVPAHWEEMTKIISLRDKIAPNTIIIGNGDIINYSDLSKKVEIYGMDGGMIGRGIFSTPNAFSPEQNELNKKDRITLCNNHIKLFENKWENRKKYDLLKKYYKVYIQGFDGAKELRIELMQTKSPAEALDILFRYNN